MVFRADRRHIADARKPRRQAGLTVFSGLAAPKKALFHTLPTRFVWGKAVIQPGIAGGENLDIKRVKSLATFKVKSGRQELFTTV